MAGSACTTGTSVRSTPSASRARPAGGVNGQIIEEFMATGAMVAGRGTFEPAGGWGGDHHDGVPIWVFSRHEPGIDVSQWPLVTYVDDVTTAMTEAKRAAGDRNVAVHGAATAQLALAAGVLDELELHLVPVLLGQGRRLSTTWRRADRSGAHPGPRGRGSDPCPLPRSALKLSVDVWFARAAPAPIAPVSSGSSRQTRGTIFPKLVITHGVVDVDRWLEGKADRAEAIESGYGSNVTDYVASDGSNNIAITADVGDVSAMQSMLASPPPEVAAKMQEHGVVPPITAYIEA